MISQAGTQFVNMPPCDGFNYLLEWFFELGLVFTFPDIGAWSTMTNTKLSPFEVTTLRSMSNAYQSFSNKAIKRDCNAPYFNDTRTPEERNKQIATKFRNIAKQKGA